MLPVPDPPQYRSRQVRVRVFGRLFGRRVQVRAPYGTDETVQDIKNTVSARVWVDTAFFRCEYQDRYGTWKEAPARLHLYDIDKGWGLATVWVSLNEKGLAEKEAWRQWRAGRGGNGGEADRGSASSSSRIWVSFE